jgi:hypothetical protein
VARNLRADLHAFYVADAGLNHALSIVSRSPSAAAVVAGPDGVAGTADDGGILDAPAAQVPFPAAPYGYTVDAQPLANGGVRIRSLGVGWDGATKQLEAVVFWPAGEAVAWWREVL